MKTKILLAGLVVGLLGFFSKMEAQVTGDETLGFVANATGSVDTVTVGSVMPYHVSGDVNFHLLRGQGLFQKSNFDWSVTGTATGFQLRNFSGAAASTPAPSDTAISVQWITTGTYHVLTQEVPVPAAGMPAISCPSNTNDLPVLVVDRPTVDWVSPDPLGGCGVDETTIDIPVDLTGTGKYEITYGITYTNLAGVTTDIVAAGTQKLIGAYVHGNQNNVVLHQLAIPNDTYGTYTVTIENISDRISRKSGVATTNADRPATTLKVYSYPTPTTQPIQHIKNL